MAAEVTRALKAGKQESVPKAVQGAAAKQHALLQTCQVPESSPPLQGAPAECTRAPVVHCEMVHLHAGCAHGSKWPKEARRCAARSPAGCR